jgi:hypothetical protein
MVAVMQHDTSYVDRQSRLQSCKGLPAADTCPRLAGKGHAHAVVYDSMTPPSAWCSYNAVHATCVLSMYRIRKNRKGLCPPQWSLWSTQCTTTHRNYMWCIVGLGKLMQFSLHTPALTSALVGFTSLSVQAAAAVAAAMLWCLLLPDIADSFGSGAATSCCCAQLCTSSVQMHKSCWSLQLTARQCWPQQSSAPRFPWLPSPSHQV